MGFKLDSHKELIDSISIAKRPLRELVTEVKQLYLSDQRPWIIGFSGGKDSTTVLSLIYQALIELSTDERHKPIYVVSSDTLVETPVVVDMIEGVLEIINTSAKQHNLPISAHAVHPKEDQTFWVNLLGRGYPAPRQSFRWCTERMKIDPVSDFITSKAAEFGEVIVCLGSRSQESASRAQVIKNHSIEGSVLSRHTSLPNAFTYMPISTWSADEVWEYLLRAPCPWGGDNQLLFELYKGSNQGECPLVIDTSTPSCGNSRFGCWTCTVVNEDKALHSLVEGGETWMAPLLEFRNDLFESTKPENKEKYRNYKRRTGRVDYINTVDITDDSEKQERHVPGPYWMNQRKEWLTKLLHMQRDLEEQGHNTKLIKDHELHQIREQWLRDPNEPDWEDSLPEIWASVFPNKHLDWIYDDGAVFSREDITLMRKKASEHNLPAELIMKLIEAEQSVTGLGKRRGIIKKIESVLSKDWESLEEVKARRANLAPDLGYKANIKALESSIEEINSHAH